MVKCVGPGRCLMRPWFQWLVCGKELYCNLGWSLSSGDVNADGYADLIVGAPFAPAAGTQRGMIAVFYSSSALRGLQRSYAHWDW